MLLVLRWCAVHGAACVAGTHLNFQRPQPIPRSRKVCGDAAAVTEDDDEMCTKIFKATCAHHHHRQHHATFLPKQELKRAEKENFYFVNNNLEFTGWVVALVVHGSMSDNIYSFELPCEAAAAAAAQDLAMMFVRSFAWSHHTFFGFFSLLFLLSGGCNNETETALLWWKNEIA